MGSVANLTLSDGEEFLPLAIEAGIETKTTVYPLERASRALDDLRSGLFTGAAVLVPRSGAEPSMPSAAD